jgi:hypothetical protein
MTVAVLTNLAVEPPKTLGRAVKLIEYALVRLEPECASFP